MRDQTRKTKSEAVAAQARGVTATDFVGAGVEEGGLRGRAAWGVISGGMSRREEGGI